MVPVEHAVQAYGLRLIADLGVKSRIGKAVSEVAEVETELHAGPPVAS